MYELTSSCWIEIQGKKYECDPLDINVMLGMSRDFPQIMQSSERVRDLLKEGSSDEEIKEENDALIEHCIRFLHGVLGKAEFEEIFDGRKVTSMRLLDLCAYIQREMLTFRYNHYDAKYGVKNEEPSNYDPGNQDTN